MTRHFYSNTVRSIGSLLPADVLAKAMAGEGLEGLRDSDYGLARGERLRDVVNDAFNEARSLWWAFQAEMRELPDSDRTATTLTRERWLLPMLRLLGFDEVQAEPKAMTISGTVYAISHSWNGVPLHLMGARVELDRRDPGIPGAARLSPHSLLQQYLNRSEQHLWGIVTNGRKLRILRDSISLTRQAYVEFDLEALFNGDVFPDFVLLYRIAHASRFRGERPHDCLLEAWIASARDEGIRALDQLRDGVESALVELGTGFLRHPANAGLKAMLDEGALTAEDIYRFLLRLVYRLLFLFVSEDRGLLLVPDADEVARDRFERYYSTNRLRELSALPIAPGNGDLWESLKVLMDLLSRDRGEPNLGLPGLGSFLWDPTTIGPLNNAALDNQVLAKAVRDLSTVSDGNVLRRIDFAGLGAEELGSVYESLLELHPSIDTVTMTFRLGVGAGSERKTTGSYYTPSELIAELLESALDPVLERAASDPQDPEEAILSLKVLDPAAGSGHFLVAAAHRIAKRLAEVRTGEPEPPEPAYKAALRDVVSRCLFAVDVNELAVELCKVSLWLEALEPGKPLSFLDHHVVCGNSLFGATPSLIAHGIPDKAFEPVEKDDRKVAASLRRRNAHERQGQLHLTATHWSTEPSHELVSELEGYSDSDIRSVKVKGSLLNEWKASSGYQRARLVADAWCAAFAMTKDADTPGLTHGMFVRVRDEGIVEPALLREITRLAADYRFFHWHLEFPQVFSEAELGQVHGLDGGFDVVIGNPPYVDSETMSKRYPRERVAFTSIFSSTKGNWDLFVPFVELATRVVREGGRLALLTPTKLLDADYAVAIQELLLRRARPIACLDFSATRAFPDADIGVLALTVERATPSATDIVSFVEFDSRFQVVAESSVSLDLLWSLPAGHIAFPLLEKDLGLLELFHQGSSLIEVASVSDGATTSEAYQIREILRELSDASPEEVVKLINTGTVDPFRSLWGHKPIKYLGFQGLEPVVPLARLAEVSLRRAEQASGPKVVVGGLGKRIEAVADSGGSLCGKSAVLIVPSDDVCAFALAVVLNADIASRLYRALFGLGGFSRDSLAFGPRQLEKLPVPPRYLLGHSDEGLPDPLEVYAELEEASLRSLIEGSSLLCRLGHAIQDAAKALEFEIPWNTVNRVVSLSMAFRSRFDP